MVPAGAAGSPTGMDAVRIFMGACGETGGMYDWDMAIDEWGVAV